MDLLHSQDPLGLLVGPWASGAMPDEFVTSTHPRLVRAGFYQFLILPLDMKNIPQPW